MGNVCACVCDSALHVYAESSLVWKFKDAKTLEVCVRCGHVCRQRCGCRPDQCLHGTALTWLPSLGRNADLS